MTALMGLQTRLKLAKLHLITDLRREQGDFREVVVEALRGGVDVVQVRDQRASRAELLAGLELVQSAVLQVNKTLVVGQNLAVARELEADALHLGAADEGLLEARSALPRHALVGRSVHDEHQLASAQADYLFVGPVFGGSRDGVTFPGLDLVRAAAAGEPVDQPESTPWFAVGGITAENIGQVLEAGAVRVAVSSAIIDAEDPRAAAEQLKTAVQAAWDSRPGMERYAMGAFGGGTARFLSEDSEHPGEAEGER